MVNKESIIIGAMLILITYTLGLSLVSQAFPAAQTSQTLSSTGTIETIGVGVYLDIQCSSPLTSIAWGTLEPGANQNVVCYIKNEGNTAMTLSMYASNWSPSSAENYLTLNWNYNSSPIDPDEVVQITFTLTVATDITGITTFGFDVTIVGTE